MPIPILCENSTLLGRLTGANMNTTADQAIPLTLYGTSKWVPIAIYVTNASLSLTLAVGGVYTATGKGGTALVAATQVYTALTGSTKLLALTLAAAATSDRQTATTIYLSLTTAQGAAATADIYVFGRVLP